MNPTDGDSPPSRLTTHRCALESAVSGLERLRALALEAGHDEDAQALLLEADRLRRATFRVVLVGEFSRGKSTLINALLGRRLVPSRLRPTTSTVLRVGHGEADHAEVVRADGTVVPWSIERLADVTSVGGSASDGVREVRVRLACPLLRDGIELVDTPGVNDLSTLREDVTLAHLPEADAAIFVLDAKACFTESERRFLATRVLAANVARLFFVVNKIDQLDPPYNSDELNAVRDRVLSIVGPLAPDPRVFLLAARPALEGALQGDEALRARSGLGALTAALGRFLAEERGAARLTRAVRVAAARHASVSRGLELRASLLRERREEAAARRTEELARVSAAEQALAERRRGWEALVAAEVAQVRERVLARAATLRDTARGSGDAPGVGEGLRTAFVDLAREAVADVRATVTRASRDLESAAVVVTPTPGGADLRTLAPESPESPLVTFGSAASAVGVMGVASMVGLFTPGVVLFAGILAFLHVRTREDAAEEPGRARAMQRQAEVQEAARRVLALVDEERVRVAAVAWEELAGPLAEQLAGARRQLAAAEADLSRDDAARRDAADRLLAALPRLDAALRAVSEADA